jgi:hypothetical protein
MVAETGTDLEPARVTVSEYLDHWLGVKQSKIKPRTHAGYSELLRHHVTPVIGNIRAGEATSSPPRDGPEEGA